MASFQLAYKQAVMSSILKKKILFEDNFCSLKKSWSYLPFPLLAFLLFPSCQTSRLIILIVSCCFTLIFSWTCFNQICTPSTPPTMPLSGSPMALLLLNPMLSFWFSSYWFINHSLFLKKLAPSDPRTPPLLISSTSLASFKIPLLVLYLSHQEILEGPMAQSLNLFFGWCTPTLLVISFSFRL